MSFLLERGADSYFKDSPGKDASQLAVESNNHLISRYIEAFAQVFIFPTLTFKCFSKKKFALHFDIEIKRLFMN